MSTLDIVLQRQVPVRSAAKNAESASGADATSGSENDAFSAVLSGEKRGSAAGRNKIDRENEPDRIADADATDPQELSPVSTAQSDEMLALLSNLMSSAAFADETVPAAGAEALPEMELQDAVASEIAVGAAGPVDTIDADAVADTAVEADDIVDDAPILVNEPIAQQIPLPQQAKTQKDPEGAKSEPPLDANEDAKPKAGPPVASSVTDQVEHAAVPAQSAAQLATSSRAAQPQPQSQPQPKSQTAPASNAVQDTDKASGEDKEAIRTLGSAREPEAGSASRKAGSEDRVGNGAGRKAALVDRAAEDQPAAKSGNVEVVESRRFMAAPTLSGNAQMLTRTLGEASDAARAAPAQGAAAAALPQTGQMLHTLKLQLNPIALGSVTAVLKLTGEELSVNLQVETAEAYRQLSDDNQSIVKSLRAQGYAVEQITVQHVASPDRSGNQASQQGFQGNFQGQESGDAQSSGKGNGGASQQGSNQQGGQSREQNPYSGTGSGRSDGVYL